MFDLIRHDRTICARPCTQPGLGLHAFVRKAWSIVEPGEPYLDNWHIFEKCKHLELNFRGLCDRIILNEPPGSTKSLVVSVLWNAWVWSQDPAYKFIFMTYSPALSARDARRCLKVVNSEWYRKRWPHVQLTGHAETMIETTQGGFRFSSSVRGQGTGRHAHTVVFDDPIKAQLTTGRAAVTRNELDFVNSWWGYTMPARFANPNQKRFVGVMQRLHENDLAGYILANQTPEQPVTHLCFPMRFESANPCRTPFGGDHRTVDGEMLSARFGEAYVKNLENDLGIYADAQLQQRPARAGGSIFKAAWVRYWNELPKHFDETILSWDMTFKDTIGSDYVCGQVWGRVGSVFYLLARTYEKMDFPTTCTAFELQARGNPNAIVKLIEDKANGPAVIATLGKRIVGMIPVEPAGSKVARANSVAGMHRAGNVLYPNPTLPGYSWVKDHVTDMLGFPFRRNDDTVDAETQALQYFASNTNTLFDGLSAVNRKVS